MAASCPRKVSAGRWWLAACCWCAVFVPSVIVTEFAPPRVRVARTSAADEFTGKLVEILRRVLDEGIAQVCLLFLFASLAVTAVMRFVCADDHARRVCYDAASVSWYPPLGLHDACDAGGRVGRRRHAAGGVQHHLSVVRRPVVARSCYAQVRVRQQAAVMRRTRSPVTGRR